MTRKSGPRLQDRIDDAQERIREVVGDANDAGVDAAFDEAVVRLRNLRSDIEALATDATGKDKVRLDSLIEDLDTMVDAEEGDDDYGRRQRLWNQEQEAGGDTGDRPGDDDQEADGAGGGDVQVPAHERNGKPVAAYTRSKRASGAHWTYK